MSRTFSVETVKPASICQRTVRLEEAMTQLVGTPIESVGGSDSQVIARPLHGFVMAATTAFNDHHPLVLTPDAVWLCIAQGFATHLRQNAETLRERIVTFSGRKEIKIQRDDFLKGRAENPWTEAFSGFSDAVATYVPNERKLVVCDFSTTGPAERAASEITLLDSMQEYFEYRCVTMCGIPEITLAGTKEDWLQVQKRAEQLSPYDLGWWLDALRPVLNQFVSAFDGREDRDFWKSFVKVNGMSGGPYLTGWINVLLPFLEEEPLKPNPHSTSWRDGLHRDFGGGPTYSQLPLGLSRAPFEWVVLSQKYCMDLLGGFVGVAQDSQSLALSPAIGWAVRDHVPGPVHRGKPSHPKETDPITHATKDVNFQRRTEPKSQSVLTKAWRKLSGAIKGSE